MDFEYQTIRVLHGKGDKARTVGIDKPALVELKEWLRVRAEKADPRFGNIICTKAGKHVKQSYVRAVLPRIAAKAGVTKRVHAHGFRHTFAVELARERVATSYIQRLLGHSSLATTTVYLESLSPEEAIEAIRGREW